MTSALLLARDCIIYSVNVWLVPVECAFNIIELELTRRGVHLYPAEIAHNARHVTRCPGAAVSLPSSRWHPRTWAI